MGALKFRKGNVLTQRHISAIASLNSPQQVAAGVAGSTIDCGASQRSPLRGLQFQGLARITSGDIHEAWRRYGA